MLKRLSLLLFLPILIYSCKKDKETPVPLTMVETPQIATSPKAPLTVLLSFQTSHDSQVEIHINGPEPLVHQFPQSQITHEHIILGLYPDTNNEIILQITDDLDNLLLDTVYVQTQPLPAFFPDIEINTFNKNLTEPGWTFCDYHSGKNSHLETFPFIFDDSGMIRWYFDLSENSNLVFPISRLKNGNVIYGVHDHIFEEDMFGRRINDWPIQGFKQHHDIFEKQDGNILVAVNNLALTTSDDHIIELDRTSGTIINTWDLRQVLDLSRSVISSSSVDWFHMNSVWHDPTDNSLIISGKYQGLVKVSATNELQWIMAPHKEWGTAGPNGDGLETSDYLLTALDENGTPYPEAVQMGDERVSDFDWGWGQHAAMKLSNGNIMFFDNGHHRNFGTTPQNYSRMVEYRIDEANKTVQQIWSYGENLGDPIYSRIISDVDEHAQTNNRMVTYGIVWNNNSSYSKIRELRSSSNEVVFDANINFTNLENSNEFLWHHFDFLYRAEREELYK